MIDKNAKADALRKATLQVRVTTVELGMLAEAAKHASRSLSSFVRVIMLDASRRELDRK